MQAYAKSAETPVLLFSTYFFRHTGDLESFHNLVLAYASKRTSFQCVDSIILIVF